MADEHTLSHFRESQWSPRIIDRKRYDIWEKAGSKDMRERANLRAKQLLNEHQAPPLPQAVEEVIEDVLKERNSRDE